MAMQPLRGMLKISFPGPDPNSVPLLSADNVQRLPPTVAKLFVELGQTQDLGDITILTISDTKHRPTILRTVQWLEKGEYEPFNSNTMLQVHRQGDLSPACYDDKKHQSDTSFKATATTFALFLEEVRLYAFSVLADFPELQRHSGRKIMFHYPVYADEITALLTGLARNNIKNIATVDPKLADFIGKRIACCRKHLLDEEVILPFLRAAVEPRSHFKALVAHADPECINKGIAQLSSGIQREKELSALLNVFVDTKVPHSQEPMTDSQTTSRTPLPEAYTVFKLLAEHRLLVAGRDGYGTLRVTGTGERLEPKRNQLFRFFKGELLLKLPHDQYSVNGPNDLVVRNQQGEIGEVFKGLQFKPVQDLTNRAHNVEAATTRALPSPASIKSEDTETKRQHPGDDLFADRVSRQRLH